MDNNKKLAIAAGGIISTYIILNYFDYFKLKHRFFNAVWVYLGPKIDSNLNKPKKELFSEAYGKVLDVGSGNGVTLKYLNLNNGNIEMITCVEPNKFMYPALKETVDNFKSTNNNDSNIKVEIISKTIEDAIKDGELEIESFDTIICNLVLCAIPNQKKVLKDIQKLLKPGGKFLFIEHVISDSIIYRGLEYLINPLWKTVFDNCHLTKSTDCDIKSMNGWSSITMSQVTQPPQLFKHVRGIAIKETPTKK